mmetsp:Transcript_3432/g.8492  ORF Transcript_3432/g.8492 Transcript_3432/m.8492 type:complete len:218 (+) Transcript_3432:90-743(+)
MAARLVVRATAIGRRGLSVLTGGGAGATAHTAPPGRRIVMPASAMWAVPARPLRAMAAARVPSGGAAVAMARRAAGVAPPWASVPTAHFDRLLTRGAPHHCTPGKDVGRLRPSAVGEGAPRRDPDRVRTCLRIVGYDKQTGKYLRCNTKFTDATNTMTCQHHLIGLFDRQGPGAWWNCCQGTDPTEPGCLLALHSDEVDDSELRGHSIDPKKVSDLE